ncbi:MAG: undecaprenyldiphospho-muramoylpentapeptide beta-N-acetylglucosaminyltransferase [Candidatus Margulisiibacteriota bacterium]|nr:MAG: undecaprenyldiphospho-muramoylpentapeptide beta-N-acetylglucosaminyltransferase [Candidatus Margulisbacteria bacterium GWD2_39_127]OGI02961.1 MAG: undecaprenyldiphospho-muramoylpentapeptide beta-N-acetylglucosaminyltransferase [Candidatus Margulisbacteria bacterium GWF2_38_17]OGI09446.1 MAG: undecaprenyldiphospho-muramoylpentapeptide beta-N-acetylglucosaminyltransferase [Candidatus Margulisbacteria bacterium GWE2_39_32]PZM78754.1 MAG: undecaprenyldiphospho-muramoylpentapeptide beta-N-ace
MNIIITCGGTGGHIYPALAIADELPKQSVTFIGTNDRLESSLIPQEGYKFKHITASRKNPAKIFFSLVKSLWIVIRLNPICVISTGGYVTLPVCLAALLLKKPIILQEQNAIPGKVNRLIGKFAYKVAIGLPTPKEYFLPEKVLLTGNPIRKIFLQNTESPINYNINENNKKVLVIGGSQGAMIFNQTIIDLIKDKKLSSTTFFLITGKKHYIPTRNTLSALSESSLKKDSEGYCHIGFKNKTEIVILSYTSNIHYLMKIADAVIARAGASTLTEIAALGKPSILVPYPYAANDHQHWNAQYYADNGAAKVITNRELSPQKLEAIIKSILTNKTLLEDMSKKAYSLYQDNSAAKIAKLVTSLKSYGH